MSPIIDRTLLQKAFGTVKPKSKGKSKSKKDSPRISSLLYRRAFICDGAISHEPIQAAEEFAKYILAVRRQEGVAYTSIAHAALEIMLKAAHEMGVIPADQLAHLLALVPSVDKNVPIPQGWRDHEHSVAYCPESAKPYVEERAPWTYEYTDEHGTPSAIEYIHETALAEHKERSAKKSTK